MALSGLFWTGFYQRDVLERTNDARKQYSIDVTYAHVQDGKHIPVDDVLDVIDGIDEMSKLRQTTKRNVLYSIWPNMV